MPRKTSRRPRGEGSVTRSGDRWIVRVWVGSRRLKRTTATQAEALAALADIKRQAAQGQSFKRYTVSDALDDFLSHGKTSRGWSPSTIESYESAIRVHLRPALGKRQLSDVSVRDVQQLMERMVVGRSSGRYVAHVRGVLRAAIAHAMRSEIVHRNVAALAAPPTVRRPEMHALSQPDLTALFAALEGERLRPLIVTAATLGLRRGELIALRWADVDLEDASLVVRRTGKRLGKRYVEGHPKSEKSRRAISLPPAMVNLFRRQSAAIAEERLRLGSAWTDEDRVFPGEGGGPVGQTTIRTALDRGLERAELPRIRVHDLRHTAATTLIASGGSLREAQELLGHSSFSLTADTYAHVLDDQRRATADRLEKVLGAAIGAS